MNLNDRIALRRNLEDCLRTAQELFREVLLLPGIDHPRQLTPAVKKCLRLRANLEQAQGFLKEGPDASRVEVPRVDEAKEVAAKEVYRRMFGDDRDAFVLECGTLVRADGKVPAGTARTGGGEGDAGDVL